jgi:hypothetical protein
MNVFYNYPDEPHHTPSNQENLFGVLEQEETLYGDVPSNEIE